MNRTVYRAVRSSYPWKQWMRASLSTFITKSTFSESIQEVESGKFKNRYAPPKVMYALVFWTKNGTTAVVDRNVIPETAQENDVVKLPWGGKRHTAKIIKFSLDQRYLEKLIVDSKGDIKKREIKKSVKKNPATKMVLRTAVSKNIESQLIKKKTSEQETMNDELSDPTPQPQSLSTCKDDERRKKNVDMISRNVDMINEEKLPPTNTAPTTAVSSNCETQSKKRRVTPFQDNECRRQKVDVASQNRMIKTNRKTKEKKSPVPNLAPTTPVYSDSESLSLEEQNPDSESDSSESFPQSPFPDYERPQKKLDVVSRSPMMESKMIKQKTKLPVTKSSPNTDSHRQSHSKKKKPIPESPAHSPFPDTIEKDDDTSNEAADSSGDDLTVSRAQSPNPQHKSENYDDSNVLQRRTQDGVISQVHDYEDEWSDSGSTASINTLRVEKKQSKTKLEETPDKRKRTEARATESGRGKAPPHEESSVDALITSAEAKLRKKISRVEQNVLFEIRSQFKNLLRVVVPSASLTSIGETISICKQTLGVEDIKCSTLEEFNIMEEKLGEEECRKAMKTWMLLMQNGGRDVKDSISKILTEYISKDVQLQFSGSGRKVKGAGKKDYSATHAFACMKEILLDAHSCDPTTIRSAVGKWLSGASDREGGKRERSSIV